MSSNKELVAQAVATIPLWRAFLDEKDAEQDALLAEVRNEQEVQLPESSSQEFQRKEADANKPEDLATDPSTLTPIESAQVAAAMTSQENPPEQEKITKSPKPQPLAENNLSDSEFEEEFDNDSEEEEEFNDLF